jgi:hypothetical protein
MDDQIKSQAEGDEEILTFDIPDEALERAASAEQQATTLIHCTCRDAGIVNGNDIGHAPLLGGAFCIV